MSVYKKEIDDTQSVNCVTKNGPENCITTTSVIVNLKL